MPYMLTILLAKTLRELHVPWSTSLDWASIEGVRPDIVVTEGAERFMIPVPDDTVPVERDAQERYGTELAAARG